MSGLSDLTRDDKFIYLIQRLPEAALDEDFKVIVTEMMTALNVFLNDSIKYLNHHYPLKLLKSFVGVETIDSAKASLSNIRQRLIAAVAQKAHLIIVSQSISEMEEKIMDSICSTQENNVHKDKQTSLHRRRLNNTAAWFLADPRFIAWRDDSKGLLWCSGLRKSNIISP